MKGELNFSKMTAAILAGGLGTRLRAVIADRPKVMAEIHGRPFLTYLLDQLSSAGFRSVVLCTGYMGEQISQRFGDHYRDMNLVYSREPQPCGTAGALRTASPHLGSDPVFVMNGDSYCHADLRVFGEWYRSHGCRVAMLLARVADSHRFGSVSLAPDASVLKFTEKLATHDANWINAGIYLISLPVILSIPASGSVSLEYDIFPRLIGQGLSGCQTDGQFLDIGTPEDFAKAEKFFARLGKSISNA